jgi:hypothetical protein
MNKKILYTLIFTSLFLVSTVAIFIQPAASAKWTFNVPEQAIGMDLETEVTEYDEDMWIDCLGVYKGRSVNFEYGQGEHDATHVGAKRQTHPTDFIREDIAFLPNHAFKSNVYDRVDSGLTDLMSSFESVYNMESEIGAGGISGIINSVDAYIPAFTGTYNQTTIDFVNANATTLGSLAYSPALLNAIYGKTYKGTYLERDYWVFTKDEFESDPDEEEQLIPFIEDPDDIYDAYLNLVDAFGRVRGSILNSLYYVVQLNTTYARRIYGYAQATGNLGLYNAVNTYANIVAANIREELPTATVQGKLDYAMAKSPYEALNLIGFVAANLQALYDGLGKSMPDKKTFLANLMEEGLPAHAPVDKWLERLVDNFNLDEDHVYQTAEDTIPGHPYSFGLVTYHTGAIDVDGLTVTITYEWQENTPVDPTHPTDDYRSDYELVFTYAETGTQASTEYYSGDDLFYKFESLSPAIPGYEVPILLTAAGLSILALIFIVMKKRKM